jgi:hypothetical protein
MTPGADMGHAKGEALEEANRIPKSGDNASLYFGIR